MTTRLSLRPVEHVDVVIRPPDARSLLNRALLIAALSESATLLDTAHLPGEPREMVDALERLGVQIDKDEQLHQWTISGCGGIFPVKSADLVFQRCELSARFLTAALAFSDGEYRIAGTDRLAHLSMDDMLFALGEMGAEVFSERDNGNLPVQIRGVSGRSGSTEVLAKYGITAERSGAGGRFAAVSGEMTSQFLSALLLTAPIASQNGSVEFHVVNRLVSRPYVRLTLQMMQDFGIEVQSSIGSTHVLLSKGISFVVPRGSVYRPRLMTIEPEALGANVFFAAAALCGGRVTVPGITENSIQADTDFVYCLRRMGCTLEFGADGLCVSRKPEQPLKGISVDMNEIVDSVPLMATLACFATTPTRITNIASLRLREKDRIAVLAAELRKLGADIREHDDGLEIVPTNQLHGAELDTHGDYRMALGLPLAGLRVPEVSIRDYEAANQCWPEFYDRFLEMGDT